MPARWDTVDVDGEEMRCYVSAPEGARSPGLIVIQHAGGVDDFVRSMCDRFVAEGFTAVAPDLYHREAPGSSDDPLTRMGRLRDKTVVADVNAAVAHAQSLPEIDGERLGITGYCMGARVTYLMAAKNGAFKAAVDCWGGNCMVAWGDGPTPFELTGDIACPVLGLFGEDDGNPNPADVAKIDAEMTRLGKVHEFHSYPGAGHAFMVEGRPNYREEAARDAWKHTIVWFNRYLRG
ncbi:MAG: dienelactone hydrolase family protein [Dehalococcoidia bacterium]